MMGLSQSRTSSMALIEPSNRLVPWAEPAYSRNSQSPDAAFFSVAHDPQGGQHERRVVLRLSVPLPAIPGIQQAIGDLLDHVGAMGQSPPQKPLGSPPPS